MTSSTAGLGVDGFKFNDVLGMFVFDVVLYSALAWYAGQVVPSEWGTHQKPWFIFTKGYWCPGLANRWVEEESGGVSCLRKLVSTLSSSLAFVANKALQ